MHTDFLNIRFHNVAELIKVESEDARFEVGYRMCRIPARVLECVNEKAKVTAFFGCGCELRFRMISDEVTIYLKRDIGKKVLPNGICEIWQGEFQGRYEVSPQAVGRDVTAVTIRKQNNFFLEHIDASQYEYSPELYRVFLPYDYGNTFYGMEGEVALPLEGQYPEKTLLTYGSSITHGSCSLSNTGSFANRMASALSMNLRNLGFAGSCYLDECIAKQIAKEEWNVATLELGINMVEEGMDMEAFTKKCRTFVETVIRENQRPVYVISPFYSKKDIYAPEELKKMRCVIEEMVSDISKEHLKSNLYYINGLDCLHAPVLLSSDGLHPADIGMQEIAAEIARNIKNV